MPSLDRRCPCPPSTSAARWCSTWTASRRSTTWLGQAAGEQLLIEVARCLHTVVREDDLVARLGGLPALAGRDDLARARQVLTAIVTTTTGFDVRTIAGGVATAELLAVAETAGVALVHGRFLPHDLTIEAVSHLLVAVPTA